ncbi:MAG: division/cell wall cluster transcriptional repressor MraZ [Oscillospiraceae bacterium]|nr:division/cell wall cluster transcriptional repressor MraZ [Oscillospiraceae bacterium]
MLIGKYKYAVDSRNRIFIPAKFRADIGEKCVVSKDIVYNALNIYPIKEWNEFTAKIEALPTIQMRDIREMIYSSSDEAEPDLQGRIILSQQLCEDVGILNTKEVIIVGVHTHAQIWSISEWEAFNVNIKSKENKEALVAELLKIGF